MGQVDVLDVRFPLQGLSRQYGFQSPLEGVSGYTTPDCLNVRSVDPFQFRLRGGSRPGLVQVLPPKTIEIGEEPSNPEIEVELLVSQGGKDTYLRSTAATTNFDSQNLRVGFTASGSVVSRTLMHFDITQASIPAGSTIVSAYLRLWATQADSAGAAATIKRLTNASWVENQATWNVYSTGNNWAGGAGADSDTSTPHVTFNLPTQASDSTNRVIITGMKTLIDDAIASRSSQLHMLIKQDTESGTTTHTTFRDSEYSGTQGEQPRLFITYTEP